jgi:hypothetical protein
MEFFHHGDFPFESDINTGSDTDRDDRELP